MRSSHLLVASLSLAALFASTGCGGAAAAPPEAPATPAATGDAAAATSPPLAGSSAAAAAPVAVSTVAPAAATATAQPVDEPLLGKLADADVYATLNKNISTFMVCYPDALKKKNGSIKLQLRPTIGPSGVVNDAKLMKSSGDKKFDACAIDAFKKIKFPPSKGSAFVNPTWVELGGERIDTQ